MSVNDNPFLSLATHQYPDFLAFFDLLLNDCYLEIGLSINLLNLFQFENIFGLVTPLIVWLEKSTLSDVPAFFFSSDFASFGALKVFGGHVSFSVFRNPGPFHQAVFLARSYTVESQVSRSAIFVFVGIYLH